MKLLGLSSTPKKQGFLCQYFLLAMINFRHKNAFIGVFLFVFWQIFPVLGKEDSEHFVTKTSLLQAVQSTWQVPLQFQNFISKEEEIEPIETKPLTLEQRLSRIIIPKLSIGDLPFSQALKILTELVHVHDLDGDGVNFVLIDLEHKAPAVDLTVQSVSCLKILGYLKEMTHFDMMFEDNTVIFRDPESKVVQMETRIFPISRGCVLQLLNYASVASENSSEMLTEEENLKKFFGKIGVSFLEAGTGFAYDGQNIIVTHRVDALQKVGNIINLYRQSKQIAIETKFLEVQQGVLEELGVKWNLGGSNNVKVNTKDELRELSRLQHSTSGSKSDGSRVQSLVPQFPNALNFGTTAGNFLDVNTILNKYQMNVILRAIEQRSDADLMSAPKITVLSGRKAEIVVAQELRYPESYRDGRGEVGSKSGDNNSSAGSTILAGVPEHFQTRNIGVEMSVVPLVEGKDRIHLSLEPCVTEFEGFVQYGGENVITYGNNSRAFESGYYQPIFSIRKIKTEVSITDGSTLVMGGLTREEIKETNDKIPFFGSIPLLGKLFSSKGQTSQKKNLVIFVTANLLDEKGMHFIPKEMSLEKRL